MRFLEIRYETIQTLIQNCSENGYREKNDIVLFNSLISILEGTQKYQSSCSELKKAFIKIPMNP